MTVREVHSRHLLSRLPSSSREQPPSRSGGLPPFGALGGATAITAAITKFWNGEHGDVRIALLATTGAVIAVIAIALAMIISSDLRARAAGAVAIYDARAKVASAMLDLVYCSQKSPAGAGTLSADDISAAVGKQVTSLLSPIGQQLTDIGEQTASMDKRTALIVLGGAQLQSPNKTVIVTNSDTGVTGEVQDVFVGTSANGESEVQMNVNDPSSQSIKAIPLDDISEVQVRPRPQ